MWNRTSFGYSKHANASVNSAVQNSNDSSVNVSVKQRHRYVEYGGTRLNGWRNVRNRLEYTGVVVKNIAFYKMNERRLTGIAQILIRKMRNLTACKTAQIHAHQVLSTLSNVEIEQNKNGNSELKILVSVVRFRPRPPFRTVATVMWLRFSALWGCLKHAVSTLPPLGTGCGTL